MYLFLFVGNRKKGQTVMHRPFVMSFAVGLAVAFGAGQGTLASVSLARRLGRAHDDGQRLRLRGSH